MTTSDPGPVRTVFAATFSRLLSPFNLFVWLACWAFSTMAGPFGTYPAMGFGLRAAYWGILVTLAVILGFATFAITLCLLRRETNRLFPWVAAAVMTVIYAPLVIGLRTVFSSYGTGLDVDSYAIAFHVFVASAAIFMFRQLLGPEAIDTIFNPLPDEQDAETPVGVPVPRLMRRLPPHIKAEILRISANDHHVEVVTEKGCAVLRMRMLDAIDEMEPVEGMCVHRSHWVARNAVTRIERLNAHKTCVHLSNGDEIPVSRKYRANLVEAGWIPNPDVS